MARRSRISRRTTIGLGAVARHVTFAAAVEAGGVALRRRALLHFGEFARQCRIGHAATLQMIEVSGIN